MLMKRIYEYDDIQPILERLTADKESGEIEFKSSKGGFPHSFWETYSSFANTNGGTIIFGAREKDGQFFLDGITREQAEKYMRDFFNNMHSKQNVNIPLLTEKDVQMVELDGAYFLFFYIPRANISLRPVFCGLDPYTGTYRRDIEGDYHCSREEINSMYADANLGSPVDGRILKNYSKDDLDGDSIKQYRRLFEKANPDHVWSTLPEDEFLEKINVFRTDRKTGEKGLTYAGLLMFGTYSAIMDENPNFFPDYQEIENPKDRWVNRIYPDGNWESNLFQFYRRVLPILQGFLPKPFRLEGNQRINETAAHVAVREALTNLCIHADHTENSTLNVYKYPNKIVFSNPGTMLISLDQYYKGGESICRNKYLQTMFMFLGSSEKAGSGTDKILHGWEEQNWKKPYIMEKSRPNKVVLTMPLESLMDDHVIEALSRHFGKRMEGLSHQQVMALALAYSEEEITNERLQHALDMHRADITDMLSKMCSMQLLESSGYGRGKKYHVYGIEVTTFDGKVATSGRKVATSDGKVATSGRKVATSDRKVATLKKRYSKEELRKMILDVCRDWRTIEEISYIIERDSVYLRNKVIPQMSDLLEKMYENIPHHPRQKYRARQQETD